MRRIALLVGAVIPLVGGWWQTALAHPEGLPGIVRLEVEGETVVSEWVLAADDAQALSDAIGGPASEQRPEGVDDYFASHFEVRAAGVACASAPRPREPGAVAAASYRCKGRLEVLEITSSLLLDIDTRYRTLVAVIGPSRTERRFLGAGQRSTRVSLADRPNDGSADVAIPEEEVAPSVGGLPSLERRFVAVVDRPGSLAAVLFGLAGAVVVGAVHALSPGHGKSVAGAYLVGARARPGHALVLGGLVAAMHTGSTLVLGLVSWYASRSVAPGEVVDVLRVVTALVVLGVGGYLAVTRTRRWRADGAGDHHHDHDHAGGHDHAHHHHHHDHVDPFSRRGIIALGLSGGLVPSPAAVVVLLAGLSAERVPLALALLAAFSIGLAGAVAGAGIVLLRGRDLVLARPSLERAQRWLPLIAAYTVLGVGVLLTFSAVRRL